MAFVFLISLAYLADAVRRAPPNIYDEGAAVYRATRMLQGELPYRDFLTPYPPGQFYILTAAFRVFGKTLLVERLLSAVILSTLACGTYLLSSMLASRRLAFVWAMLGTLWIEWALQGQYVIPSVWAIVPLAFAVAALGFYAKDLRKTYLILAGVFVGFTMLLRHDFGLCAALVLGFMSTRIAPRRLPGMLLFGFSVIVPLVIPVVWLLGSVGGSQLLFNLLLFPVFIYPVGRKISYPHLIPDLQSLKQPVGNVGGPVEHLLLHHISFYVPFVILMAVCRLVLSQSRARAADSPLWQRSTAVTLGLMTAVLLVHLCVRPDVTHLAPILVCAVPLLAWMSHLAARARGLGDRWLSGVTVGVMLMLLFAPILADRLVRYSRSVDRLPSEMTPDRASGILAGDAALYQTVQYIRGHVPPDARIYAGATDHRQLLVPPVMLYFLAERESATRHWNLIPGVATTDEVQWEICRSLEDVDYLVLLDVYDPDLAERLPASYVLDECIDASFSEVQVYGPYHIRQRHASRRTGAD